MTTDKVEKISLPHNFYLIKNLNSGRTRLAHQCPIHLKLPERSLQIYGIYPKDDRCFGCHTEVPEEIKMIANLNGAWK